MDIENVEAPTLSPAAQEVFQRVTEAILSDDCEPSFEAMEDACERVLEELGVDGAVFDEIEDFSAEFSKYVDKLEAIAEQGRSDARKVDNRTRKAQKMARRKNRKATRR